MSWCNQDIDALMKSLQDIFSNKTPEEAVQLLAEQLYQHIISKTPIELIKDVLFYSFVFKILTLLFNQLYGYGIIETIKLIYQQTVKYFSKLSMKFIPVVKKSIDKEKIKTRFEMESATMNNDSVIKFDSLPSHGLSAEQVLDNLDSLQQLKHANWEDGRISGAVYHGGKELTHLQTQAFEKFAVANQLHPDAFPGVRQMEAEVVSMVLKIFDAPIESGACGTTTSGGTESLLLACLSAREKGLAEKGITEPEIVAPMTIHAAVFKAAKYFNIKLKLAAVGPDFKVDINQVKRLVTQNTVLIMGSAPNFPHGIVDDIEALSKIAKPRNIPLHVDCCLGSFIIAYYKRAFPDSRPINFDFNVPGVTSISCDTHKYGFTPKGSSVIMYRSPEIRKYQYYVTSTWPGGLYGSPTLAGSRPGVLTVGAWATMTHIGDDGYLKSCQDIVGAAQLLRREIEQNIPELEIIGDPKLSVIAFKSDVLNVHKLSDLLGAKGWHLSTLQRPNAIHLALTRLTVPVIGEFIQILKDTVRELVDLNEDVQSSTAQMYGAASNIALGSFIDDVIGMFIDCMYQVEKTVEKTADGEYVKIEDLKSISGNTKKLQ
ncbi:unnamed protein product [Ambrosiozyma monospora]|uniref:sphinganine-1-phosphate aldolase n=1 Tax=Ambrosiozyma monospora TaxID=43982 RepID=A0A9W7DHV1_AMBMO|nr:unnamed protein product [Ambrosiozyma monospora]